MRNRNADFRVDPATRWKLSPMDIDARDKWEYSKAKDATFAHTNIPEAPWFTVEADEKNRLASTY